MTSIDFLFSRWRGENVSTEEVADVLGLMDCVQEVIVYGVSVPGMSAIMKYLNKIIFNTLTKYQYTALQSIGVILQLIFCKLHLIHSII